MPADSDNSNPSESAIDQEKDRVRQQNLALNLIRTKLDALYQTEPDTLKEEQEALSVKTRSKHQQFMYELTTSGKDLAQVQSEWHDYYQNLNDEDKRQVWQEFYSASASAQRQPSKPTTPEHQIKTMAKHVERRAVSRRPRTDQRSAKVIKEQVRAKAVKNLPPRLTWKHHLQSLLFGLAMGIIVVVILLFGFFNQVIIAPFLQPSRHDTATPIILSTDSVAPSATPEVIIPKINVEIPVDYNVNTTNENVIENDLEGGVIHYPTTSLPGQTGNTAYFGHSSNNILNPGKYKFAFVLLHDLVNGDVFYLTYSGKVYAYKVFSTSIVSPDEVSVLNPVAGHVATATLITCDPPGTSINRLVVVGDQISPSPTGDTAPTPSVTTASAISQLPDNGPSLWHRYISTVWGKIVSVGFILGVIYVIWRWYDKEFNTSKK